MQNPINYNIDVLNPLDASLEGYKRGLAIQDDLQQRRQQALLNERNLQMRQDLTSLYDNKNVTAADIARTALKYPELTGQLKQQYDMMNEAERNAQLNVGTNVYAALVSNQPGVATSILRREAEAQKNSGDTSKADMYENLARTIEVDPRMALVPTGLILSSLMGDKFGETFAKISEEQRQREQAPAETAVKNIEAMYAQPKAAAELRQKEAEATQAEVTAARAPATQQAELEKLQAEIADKRASAATAAKKAGQPTDAAIKVVNESADAAAQSRDFAFNLNALADQFETSGAAEGILTATPAEFVKRVFGSQNAVTSLRQRYTQLRNSEISKILKPPVSDRDIELMMKGYPPETGNVAEITNFLRWMADASDVEAGLNEMKADWAGAVGHLGRTNESVIVAGTTVQPGETYSEFRRSYAEWLRIQIDKARQTRAAGARSYQRFRGQ